jgi:hypothetical protein
MVKLRRAQIKENEVPKGSVYRSLDKPDFNKSRRCSEEVEKIGVHSFSELYKPYCEFLMQAKTDTELEARARIIAGFECPNNIPQLKEGRNISAAVRRMTRKIKKFGEGKIAGMTADAEVVTKKDKQLIEYKTVKKYYNKLNNITGREIPYKPKWEPMVEVLEIPVYKEIEVPDYVQIRITIGGNEILVVPMEVTFEKLRNGVFASSAIGIVAAVIYEIAK